jgi:hypothetical protein
MYMLASILLSWAATHLLCAAVWCRARASGTALAYKDAGRLIEWELGLRTHGAQESDQPTIH